MPNESEDIIEYAPPPNYDGLTLLDMLSRAQRALYATLLGRIEAGTADKDDIKVLRQLLAENGMVIAVEESRKMIDVSPNKQQPVAIPDYRGERYDE